MYKLLIIKRSIAGTANKRRIPIRQLFVIFFMLVAIKANAWAQNQKISLSETNSELMDVFERISSQTGFDFILPASADLHGKRVTIQVADMSLNKVLSKLFADGSFNYRFMNKSIVVSKKIAAPVRQSIQPSTIPQQQSIMDISGKVLDSLGAPLQGATIRLKRTGKLIQTDANGVFEFSSPGGNEIVEISYVGYLTERRTITGEYMVIQLKPSRSKLDEVMVMAYSNTTRRLSTGSSGQVGANVIANQPVSNPILTLEGRIPGLFITQTAGYAGANASVNIRGQNSLGFNVAAPLYVIDGVPFGSSPVEKSVGGFSASSDFSPLNTINPADIQSIDVLKDADATSIYGSRGANGVILITTKKGRAGRTNVAVDFSQGFGGIAGKVEILGTEQYLAIRRQAFENDKIAPTVANAPDLTVWDQGAYTDFPKLLIGNTAKQTTAGLSLSGGDAYTQFTLGGTFRKESTVYYGSSDDKATQLKLTVQHKTKDSKFATSASVSYNMDNNTVPLYNINLTNYGLPPNYPLYKEDGSLYSGAGYNNPLAAFNETNNLKSSNLNATASMRYTIIPGLDIKANGGFNLIDVKGLIISPADSKNPAYNPTSTVTMNNNYIRTYIAEPQINYHKVLGKGKMDIIAGGSWQQTETVQPFWIYGNYTNIQLVKSLGATTILAKTSGYSDTRYASAFGRVEYNWQDKYLISGNIRRDGSSKFGKNNRFGTFGSIATAWIFSKENVAMEALPWLSFGKIRASYGTVGNDKIAEYGYQSNYFAGPAYGPDITLAPVRIANQHLKWEQTKKLDIALDLGFLKDRILFAATYYRNRSSDLLGNIPLPDQTGFSNYTANFDATVQNRGIELELNTVNMTKKKFKWTSSFNLTVPENKLVDFPGLKNSTYNNQYVVGQSLNLRTVFKSAGIIDGIATVEDVDGDGVISSGIYANGKGDYIVFGNNDPKFYGGLNNTFNYGGFQLDVFLQGISRTATRGDLNFGTYPGTGYNLPVTMVDTGLKYSSNTSTPAGKNYQYFTNTDRAIESASFLRLKNVSLAYTVSSKTCKKMRMSALQLYARAQNLLTFSSYKGLDPETLTTQVPPLRMFVLGFRTTL